MPPGGRKPVIGLTGGVGAGKSSVSSCLAALGAAIVDTDALAHEEACAPEVIETLRGWWGESVIGGDGLPDRSRLAEVVFSRSGELARLEGLLHPRILSRCDALIAQLREDDRARMIVVDAPKLYEAGVDGRCDAVLYVDTDRAVRIERVAATRGWTSQELIRRDDQLAPLDEKRALADYVIENNSSIDDLRSKVECFFDSVLASFK